MRRLLIALTSLSVVAAMGAIATPAGAAFPGANGKIVFAFMSSDVNDTNEIYVMNPDGTDRTRLTNNSAADYYPAVSPDGSKIAFASLRDGNPEIYVMNLDGSGQTRLTSNSWIDFSPAWSPDGSKIAFGSTRDGNYEIYVMNADGTGQTNLTNNGAEDQSAVWSPDGAKIAFDSTRNGDRDVFTMNPDGTGQTNITNTPGFDENPDWSPDGAKIVFDSRRDGNYEVYSMNADGTGQTRLTNDASHDVWPIWSPDGTKVAFASLRDGNTEIYTMNADGTGQTRLTNNSTSDFYLDWQPLPLDTDPPQTTITSGPHGTTTDDTPEFSFDSSEAGSTFECQLDSSGWETCTSPHPTAVLSNGFHTLRIRATDATGNVDASPTVEPFTVLTTPGSVTGWGMNDHGQATPPPGNDYVGIAGGKFHSLGLRADGSIAGWGVNSSFDYGQANPPAGNNYVAVAAGGFHSLALRSDGSIVGWGLNFNGQASPPAGGGFVAIAAGLQHSLALRSDGSIVGWGANTWGQAAAPAGDDYVAVAAGYGHSLALRSDGSVIGWGNNDYGAATPPAGNDHVAIVGGQGHSLALRSDGSIVGWGRNDLGAASPPAGNDYVALAAGYHSLALRADGSVAGWGYNSHGQATPPGGGPFVAIAAGELHSLGLRPAGPTPPPTISGDLSCNSVNGNGFAANSSVSVTVKDAPGGTTVYTNPSVPTDGTGNLNLFCGFGPDLTPGMEITVSGGSDTKVLVLADLTIDSVNPATDMVSGTAPSNASVFVGVSNPPSGGAALTTTADGTGAWSVDFTGTFDITGGTHANASVSDADGDRTFVNKLPATISGDLSCNSVNGNGFASNSSVSVVVKAAPGGSTVYDNPSVPTDGPGNFNLFCGFGPDLTPGMEITVSGGSDTKVLVLADLTIDSVNPATDVVSGTAPSGAEVQVGVNNPPGPGGAMLTTSADGTGAWSVDFTGTFDITGGTHANASVSDADGDRTFVNKLPATISGDLSCNSVNGNGFASNSSVSVVVKAAPGGSTVYDNPSVPTDGPGNFNLFCGFGPDLTPGMEITVSGGSDPKVLVLADLTIDSVNPATDVVSGTAPANASVFVGVNNPPGPGGAGQNSTADGSGNWSVDFTGTFDITGGTHANASVPDPDGDQTFVNKAPATINGDITNDGIGGGGFDPNATVTVEVRDAPGGSLLVTATMLGDGQGNFNLCCGAEVGLPDLVPGMEITASQGATTKVLVLVNITIDSVDPATDVVAGTAPANSSVFVGVNNPPGPGGAGQNTTADGSGNWSVDFTGTFDITAGTNANASVSDADGDTTNFNKQAPSINGNISDDFIGGEAFEPSATVTVEVRDAPGGTLVFTGTSPTDGGGSFGLCCGPEVGLPDLVPGMEITVSDGSSAKVLVLVNLTIDSLDPATDVVSGTAPANSSLFVGVNNSFGEAGLNSTADGAGNWSADFTGTFDIDPTTQAEAHVFDDDGDATSAQERPPTIHASYCCLGNVNGDDFTPNASVTLEILDSPGGTPLLSQVVPTDRFGSFGFNLETTGVSFSPGMQVVVTDATTSDSKELTLVPLTFDSLNPSTDAGSGTAEPGTTVLVEIFADPGVSLEVVADGSGIWTADFGAIGFDVTSAMGAIARVPDVDGDTTDDEVFTPTISGGVLSDFVSGSDFTPNASVEVQIFDSPGGTLLFSGSIPTGGEFGDFGLGFDIHGVDLVPGTHIVVTDGVTTATKELTLVSMSFDVLDPVTDTASGTAPPNATVVVEVFDSGAEFFKETMADGAGRWTVDLGAEGFDVIQGGGNATVSDDDGDGTVADRGVPTFSATLSTDEVGGYSFTNSSTVTIEIFDSPGGALLFSGSAPVGSDSTFNLGSGTHGVDLAPGMHITVMDDTTSITKELTLVSITFDVLDPVNDVASGTAPPGMPLGLKFPEGGGETAPADANGDWFADLGAGGGDITPDISATICAVDGDGDCTAAEYVPEADLLLLKTDPPGRQPTARNMTYTLTVSNVGPKAAYEATATDVLPSSVTFVSATPTQGSCSHSGGTVTCNLGTIASGGTVTIAIVVRPTVAGTIVNTASVGASTPDPNSNNNVDSENTSICRITSRRQSIPCG